MRVSGCFKGQSRDLPYIRRYEIAAEQDEVDKRFWAGVHKGIMQISSAPPDIRERSREWLINNGFSTWRLTDPSDNRVPGGHLAARSVLYGRVQAA